MSEDERLAGIEVMSRMAGIPIEVKAICHQWILLTYDLPATKEGDKARSAFLKRARAIGAIEHTASVYLLPWTPESENLALDVAEAGHAYLWTSEVKDEKRARELTSTYDTKLEPVFDQIGERIDRIEGHQEKRPKLAQRMAEKTRQMLDDVEAAITRRGSADLYVMVIILRKRLEGLWV